mgnify:CR=1 FL=1
MRKSIGIITNICFIHFFKSGIEMPLHIIIIVRVSLLNWKGTLIHGLVLMQRLWKGSFRRHGLHSLYHLFLINTIFLKIKGPTIKLEVLHKFERCMFLFEVAQFVLITLHIVHASPDYLRTKV